MQQLMQFKWPFLAAIVLIPMATLSAQGVNPKDENILAPRDLKQIVQSQELDSYWLDQRMWYEYGYRPHVKMQKVYWPRKLPADMKNYVYGPDWRIDHKLDLGDPAAKYKVQWGKDGTWH